MAVAKKDTSKILLLYAIAEQYENSEPDKARKYIKQGGELSREINYQPGIMKSYRMLSYVYSFQSKFDSVIYYNRLVLDIARSRNDSFNIGVSFFNIGIGFRFMSELDSAVVYTLQGAKLLEGKGYSNIESSINDGLQTLYMTLGQYEKAISYGNKAVELARKLEDQSALANSLSNLGLSYSETNRVSEAKKIYLEALQIAESTNNKSIQAVVLNNLSDIAIKENQFDRLKTYAERSIALAGEMEDEGTLISGKLSLAAYLLSRQEYVAAQEQALAALALSEKQNLLEGKTTSLGMLSAIAFSRQDYKKGFEYYYQKMDFEGKVFNQSLQQKEAALRIRYETEKKDTQILLQRTELQRKTVFNYLLIGGAAALLLITLLSYRTYRQKQKLQQHRIEELETQQQLLAAEAVMKGEEQERTRLAKDLHDGLGGMLSGIKYSFQTMKGNLIMTPENQQAFERSMDMLDSSIKEMRRVAHNMMPEVLVKFGLDTAMKDFCDDINRSGALRVVYQSLGMDLLQVEQTAAIAVYRIVQELLNNTMKHAAAKTAIVQLSRTDAGINITVEDDGKGFDPVILSGGKGIGWSNIQSRVEYLKGKMDVRSTPGNGTSVNIEFNL
ncbi:MAG TPA: sensor histidine kinase [Chitinophagaceae bacterium]|nr:sensor histidine kinase [Chitinophagaceae bacterium]